MADRRPRRTPTPTPTPTTTGQVRALLATIPDPEIPAITITDLGIVRDVSLDGTDVHVAITPTYSGCPATSAIAFAVETTLLRRRPDAPCHHPHRPALDDRLDRTRSAREAARLRHRPPHARRRGDLPALRRCTHHPRQPVRLDPLQGAVALRCLSGTLRPVQVPLMKFQTLTVTDVHKTTRDAVVVTLDAPFDWIHGQYLTLRRDFDGTEIRRSYSICSAPGTPCQIAVKRVDGGAFSTWVNDDLTPGDTLDAMPPAGRFHTPLDPDAATHYLLVAAGSGITPILSIARTVLVARAAVPRDASLRQPRGERHHVPDRAGRPEIPAPDPAPDGPHPQTGRTGYSAVHRAGSTRASSTRCSAAGSTRPCTTEPSSAAPKA